MGRRASAIAQTFEASGAPTTRGRLFKADRRRAIDRYIDYFGGRPAAGVPVASDPYGDGLPSAVPSEGNPGGLA
jgi:hypothetical protein